MSRIKGNYRKEKAMLKHKFKLKQKDIKDYAIAAILQDDDLKKKAQDFRDLINTMKEIKTPNRSRTYEDLLSTHKSLDHFYKDQAHDEQPLGHQQELKSPKTKRKLSIAQKVFKLVTNHYVDIVFSLATAIIFLTIAANPIGITLAAISVSYTIVKAIAKISIFKKIRATRRIQEMLDSPIGRLFRSKSVKIVLNTVQKSLEFVHNPIGSSIAIALRFSGAGIDYYKNNRAARFAVHEKLLEEAYDNQVKIAKYNDRLNQLMPELNLVDKQEPKAKKLKNTKFNTSKVFAQGLMDVVFSNPMSEITEHIHGLIEPEVSSDGTLVKVAEAMALEPDAALSMRRAGRWGKNESARVRRNHRINELGIDYNGTKSLVDEAKNQVSLYQGLKNSKTRSATVEYMTSPQKTKEEKLASLKNTLDEQTKEKARKIVANLSTMSKKNIIKQTVFRQKNKIKGDIIYSR